MSDLINIIEKDKLLGLVKMDDFLKIINQQPPSEWIKDHPIAKNVKYLPIDKVELILTKIFQEWNVEILREGQLLNSIYTTVRLHYKHPVTSSWLYQDGIAAVPIKTRSGHDASDMAAILNDAIQTGLPAAESFAIKDAADKIGNIFGGNINRKDTLDFVPSYGTDEVKNDEAVTQAIEAIENTETIDDLADVFMSQGQLVYNKDVIAAKDKRKAELNESA